MTMPRSSFSTMSPPRYSTVRGFITSSGASSEVSICAMSPITGAPSQPSDAGRVALTYPFSSIMTSESPSAVSSPTRYSPSLFCFSVLGQVAECGSDMVGKETYLRNLSVIFISISTCIDRFGFKQRLAAAGK